MTRSPSLFAVLVLASCSPPAQHAPPAPPDPEAWGSDVPDKSRPVDARDDRQPHVFPWQMWRERNDKWLASPVNDICDPRSTHRRQKGDRECYPPIVVQIAALVTRYKFVNNDPTVPTNTNTLELTLDRGSNASVWTDYYVSLLDAEDRPVTRWVHPTAVGDDGCKVQIPYQRGLDLRNGTSRAAIVSELTPDDRFPDDDPRSAP